MRVELVVRFDYGSIVPWVRRADGAWRAVAGPDGLELHTPVDLFGENLKTTAEFTVGRRDRIPFVLGWFPSHDRQPVANSAGQLVSRTTKHWKSWSARCDYNGQWRDPVLRSLLTLEALTYQPTGGIVAAPTTSLPEALGRHSQLGLPVLLGPRRDPHARGLHRRRLRRGSGSLAPMVAARGRGAPRGAADHVRRRRRAAAHGARARLAAGLRRREAGPHRERRARAAPARRVRRADRRALAGRAERHDALRRDLVVGASCCSKSLERRWREPDEGIWEVRGPRRHFTHSKVMCWVAFDRAIAIAEAMGLEGPVDEWRVLRDEIHDQVCDHAFNAELGAFTQTYDSADLDAAVLMIPLVGFLPATDRARRVDDHRDRARRERGWTHLRRVRDALRAHPRWGRRDRRTGRRLPSVQLLDGRGARARRPHRRRARAVRTSPRDRQRRRDSTPRSTTRMRRVCSATSRRRSRTWRSWPRRTRSSPKRSR